MDVYAKFGLASDAQSLNAASSSLEAEECEDATDDATILSPVEPLENL